MDVMAILKYIPQVIRVRVQAVTKEFDFFFNFYTTLMPGREANHSPPSSAEVKE
jgi:hypothetical protein